MKNPVFKIVSFSLVAVAALGGMLPQARAQKSDDYLRALQVQSIAQDDSDWIYWGDKIGTFSTWNNHSNRLIPVYTFGGTLDAIKGEKSAYRDQEMLRRLYGKLPDQTLNLNADYFDQTQLFLLQKLALAQGKKNVIVMVFDGMDWQTTQAAAIYRSQKIAYTQGRGKVLSFQTYDKAITDFGYCVTSSHNAGTKKDANSQTVSNIGGNAGGGYNADFGGHHPWSQPGDLAYLLGRRKSLNHIFTDSAASATSIFCGRKTYNAAIGVDHSGKPLRSIAHRFQRRGRSVGVVTSVPISHATPAAAYAHNVSRDDYQDITRDLLGLPSAFHRDDPLLGMDVVIGSGWGENQKHGFGTQGKNFIPGNSYLPDDVIDEINVQNGGHYVVVERTPGTSGEKILTAAAGDAARDGHRLLGFFGADHGHLPFATADGKFNPAPGTRKAERYSTAEIEENPTLADMTEAALKVLGTNEKGFWLMVEPGDVDWANHNNNIDNAIGAVFSGEEAFNRITHWVETNSNWDDTLVIVTADHGHMMNLADPKRLIKSNNTSQPAQPVGNNNAPASSQ